MKILRNVAAILIGAALIITGVSCDNLLTQKKTVPEVESIRNSEINTNLSQDQIISALEVASKEKVYEAVLAGKNASDLLAKLSTEKKAEILKALITDDVKNTVYTEKLTDEEKEKIFTELLADKRTKNTFLTLLTAEEKASVYSGELTAEKKAAIFTEIFTGKRTDGKVIELLNDEEKEAVFNEFLTVKADAEFIKTILEKEGNETLRKEIKEFLTSTLTQAEIAALLDSESKNSIYEELFAKETVASLLEKLSSDQKDEILNAFLTDDLRNSIYSEKLTAAEKERIFAELLADKRTKNTFLSLLTAAEKESILSKDVPAETKAVIFNEILAGKRSEGKVTELLNDEEKEALFNTLLESKMSVEFIKTILDKEENENLRESVKNYFVAELTKADIQALLDSKDTTAPDNVTNFKVVNLEGVAKLTWTDAANDDILAYEITYKIKEESRTLNFEENSYIIPQGSEKAIIDYLENGHVYIFTIKTVDRTGNKSEGQSVECFIAKKVILGTGWFNETAAGIPCYEITKITFQAEPYTGEYTASWEANAAGEETINAYLVNDTEVIVSGNGNIIAANKRSSVVFYGFSKVEEINFNCFDTSNAVTFEDMFVYCRKLKELDLSGFNTSNVTNMSGMFLCCSKLERIIGLDKFKTSNVTNMCWMFGSCDALKEADLSSFDTAKVTNTKGMFDQCGQLKKIYVSDKFVTTAVTDSENMFEYCSHLIGGEGTTYDGNKLDASYAHIDGGEDNPGYFTLKTE